MGKRNIHIRAYKDGKIHTLIDGSYFDYRPCDKNLPTGMKMLISWSMMKSQLRSVHNFRIYDNEDASRRPRLSGLSQLHRNRIRQYVREHAVEFIEGARGIDAPALFCSLQSAPCHFVNIAVGQQFKGL